MTNILFAINTANILMLGNPAIKTELFFPSLAKHYPYKFEVLVGPFATRDGNTRAADFIVPLEMMRAYPWL